VPRPQHTLADLLRESSTPGSVVREGGGGGQGGLPQAGNDEMDAELAEALAASLRTAKEEAAALRLPGELGRRSSQPGGSSPG